MEANFKKRAQLLEELGIEKVYKPLSLADINEPISAIPPVSIEHFYVDKAGNQFNLSSENNFKFMELLDSIVAENLQDNDKEQVEEFLKPFKKNKEIK